MNTQLCRTVAVALIALSFAIRQDESLAKPPNVVLLLSDDMAWTDYGFMGHPDIATPNLDQLASQSAVFPRGYVPTGLCRPSLATLLTGHYASTHGITGNDPSPKYADRGSALYNQRRGQLLGFLDRYEPVADAHGKQGIRPTHHRNVYWTSIVKAGR